MHIDSRILITGHNGFVGNNLYKKLLKLGYKDIFVSNRKSTDLRNQCDVSAWFKLTKPDYVFNCSGKVGGIKANIDNHYMFLLDNLQMQNNVIDNSIKHKVKKVITLGSSCIYPKDYKQPLKEEYLLQAPPEPTNEGYALAKIIGLKMCEYANKKFNTKFVSLMPSNLYGVADDFNLETSHVLSAIVKKVVDAHNDDKRYIELWGDGSAKREFLYIDDLTNCMIWAIDNLDIETFINVGTGKDISIKELAELICNIVGYQGNIKYDTTKPNGMLRKCLSVEKINNLGWKHKVSLEEGICNTIKYYKAIK